MDIDAAYRERYPTLVRVSQEIEKVLREMLRGTPRIDAVTARAKSIERFVEKAQKAGEDGKPKYNYPLQDIQDQLGARVVVFYRSDVDTVAELILKEFRVIEDKMKESSEPDRFGYEAKHYICLIPLEISENSRCPVDFFELQVSTLFQHAWAEANHDLGYKPGAPMDFEHQRKIAWAAALAYGADFVFDELQRLQSHN